ncbi:phage recombination protein Bet [Streptomyces lavendulae]|uniref:phage recombination protein Bet n=1 Tax=Streptomyces lavendulae TaxID=1914 RepID=UPI003328855C
MSTELTPTSGSLAIRPDQTVFSAEQAAVLQQFGIDDDVTPAELSGFLHLCQRTKLDPFSRQIYLIGRKDKKAGRKVFTPQTGIDGYRVIAHRVIAETREAFGYEDALWCDAGGRWRDVWLAEEPPAAAKVTILRNGQRFSAVAVYREYVQTDWNGNPTRMWKNMGANQIAKCAEALALRKAFPHDLAGVYTAEEMAQADNPEPERHLRSVQPGEADPWASESPESVVVKGRSLPAQQLADAATDATLQAAVADIYRQARDAGLLPETVKVNRELLELGAYLIARGKELAAPAPEADPVTDAQFADPVAEAEQQLRATAARVGLDTLDADFEQSYGLPISEAGLQQLNEMNKILGGAA